MSTDWTDIVILALIALVVSFFLVKLVRELGWSLRRKWLLFLGLGSGVIAFMVKLVLIISFSTFPQEIMALFPQQDFQLAMEQNNPNENSFRSQLRKQSYRWAALPETAPEPINNPTTPEKVRLGKKLFFDRRLSIDESIACASCHALNMKKGGADGLQFSKGIKDKTGDRNAPTVYNAAFQRVLFWDGRAASLEEQAKGPILNPVEMAMPSFELLVKRLKQDKAYAEMFALAFPESPQISSDNITKAIASFERTLITPDSAYDRFVRGDRQALNQSQLRGMALFEKTGCVHCHSGPNFSGASIGEKQSAFRIFPAMIDEVYEAKYKFSEDLGLASGFNKAEQGIWRIPSLRNVALTAPYFHNGSVDSLEEAVRVMARVQLNLVVDNETGNDMQFVWSYQEKQLAVLNDSVLNDEDVQDLVAFLEALSGNIKEM